MAECDQRLQQYLGQREDRSAGVPLPDEKRRGRRKTKRGNAPAFDMRAALYRVTGVDRTRIDGIDTVAATTVITEGVRI